MSTGNRIMGPKETSVRATLDSRPANVIQGADSSVRWCFAGFFNGANHKGVIFKPERDDLSIGKAECEWDWRDTWGQLKQLGLIDWREEDVSCHDGNKMIYVHLTITDKGQGVREDDLAYFRSVLAAMDEDEEPNRAGT